MGRLGDEYVYTKITELDTSDISSFVYESWKLHARTKIVTVQLDWT